MLRIRLQRRGRRKRPLHHIVVADSRSPRDGRIIEDLGRFNNLTALNELKLNEERAIHWLKQGAQPSDTVRSIFKKEGIMYRMHLIRWGKSEEEIEAALAEWREAREVKEEKAPTRKERQRAMLEAEEKEFQKQLKKKAEEAAKEKAKQEALASDEEGDEEEAKAEAEVAEKPEATEATAEETEATDAEDEVREEVAEEETAEIEVEEPQETEEEQVEAEAEGDEETEDESAEEEVETKEEQAEETQEEVKAEGSPTPEASETEETSEEETEAEDGQTSTDMLAKEAIEHIENTSLEDLKGFVTDDEDRVTVQRAWEEKQEG